MEQQAAIFHTVHQQQQSCTKFFVFPFHDLVSLHRMSSVPWFVEKVGGITKSLHLHKGLTLRGSQTDWIHDWMW